MTIDASIQPRMPPPYDAVGWAPGSAVRRRIGPPLAGASITSPRPSKLSRYASQAPSGDQRGSASARTRATIPAVTRIDPPSLIRVRRRHHYTGPATVGLAITPEGGQASPLPAGRVGAGLASSWLSPRLHESTPNGPRLNFVQPV